MTSPSPEYMATPTSTPPPQGLNATSLAAGGTVTPTDAAAENAGANSSTSSSSSSSVTAPVPNAANNNPSVNPVGEENQVSPDPSNGGNAAISVDSMRVTSSSTALSLAVQSRSVIAAIGSINSTTTVSTTSAAITAAPFSPAQATTSTSFSASSSSSSSSFSSSSSSSSSPSSSSSSTSSSSTSSYSSTSSSSTPSPYVVPFSSSTYSTTSSSAIPDVTFSSTYSSSTSSSLASSSPGRPLDDPYFKPLTTSSSETSTMTISTTSSSFRTTTTIFSSTSSSPSIILHDSLSTSNALNGSLTVTESSIVDSITTSFMSSIDYGTVPTSDMSYTSSGVTLTGAAAAAALAAATGSMSDRLPSGGAAVSNVSSAAKGATGKTNLSSFAIVGIVGGILVVCILAYLAWYQWRKKRAQASSLGDELQDGNGDLNAEKKSHGDASRRRPGRRSEDPFNDSRQTQYGETWYQDSYNDDRDENLDDERTAEDQRDKRRRSGTYVEDDGRAERLSLDDGIITALGDNLKTGTDGLTTYGNNFTRSYDSVDPPFHHPNAELRQAEDDDGMDTAIAGKLETGIMGKDPMPDPFASPLFPSSSAYAALEVPSDSRDGPSRAGTDNDPPITVTSIDPMTPAPATSSLLPWLSKKQATVTPPPVPSGPAPQIQASRSRTGRPEPSRPPPAPVMVQTPMIGRGGWQGVIPNFR